jgi:hypothetical protein
MAQVFVVRADLLTETAEQFVAVVATYGNAMETTIDMHGPACTLLLLGDDLITIQQPFMTTVLKTAWRTDYKPVINFEAARRINLAFPEYKQRNYTAQYQEYITTYGADTAAWPTEALTFKAEYDRGWQYVNDVRSASNAWTQMPVDPTDNSIWPVAISPIT